MLWPGKMDCHWDNPSQTGRLNITHLSKGSVEEVIPPNRGKHQRKQAKQFASDKHPRRKLRKQGWLRNSFLKSSHAWLWTAWHLKYDNVRVLRRHIKVNTVFLGLFFSDTTYKTLPNIVWVLPKRLWPIEAWTSERVLWYLHQQIRIRFRKLYWSRLKLLVMTAQTHSQARRQIQYKMRYEV